MRKAVCSVPELVNVILPMHRTRVSSEVVVTSSFSSGVGSGDWAIAELRSSCEPNAIPEASCVRLGANIKPSQVDIFQVTLAEQQYDMLGAKVKPDYILTRRSPRLKQPEHYPG